VGSFVLRSMRYGRRELFLLFYHSMMSVFFVFISTRIMCDKCSKTH